MERLEKGVPDTPRAKNHRLVLGFLVAGLVQHALESQDSGAHAYAEAVRRYVTAPLGLQEEVVVNVKEESDVARLSNNYGGHLRSMMEDMKGGAGAGDGKDGDGTKTGTNMVRALRVAVSKMICCSSGLFKR